MHGGERGLRIRQHPPKRRDKHDGTASRLAQNYRRESTRQGLQIDMACAYYFAVSFVINAFSWAGERFRVAAIAKRVHLLWLGVGTNKMKPIHNGLTAFNQVLDQTRIKHVFFQSPGTAHEWQTWRRDLNDFAPRLFQHSSRSA